MVTFLSWSANKAQAKSLSYYALSSSPYHYIHLVVVKDELWHTPGLDPHKPVEGGGATVVRTFRADTQPLPTTPYQKFMQFWYGNRDPSMISTKTQAELFDGRAQKAPLALARPRQLINTQLHVTDMIRPQGKYIRMEMSFPEWLQMRAREMSIQDKLR
ncbi:hypothetical protein M409DRAFT_21316 [Zasmidium cellare ATCC 36951]|uniref:Uncharacterized protein n=1 Tax=Zasmidium cellare ATCC 36951 TaxID=1080233 RepID=A0A6A6CSW7_ZASCE|nr:uncharacterized protein M409DRAFT_21316 [Zasmidium cellare ATCC 36951]KAF2168566.1 hypothetical protein M409DRAFT_21316 [Zasmidium cellare ATCC 36951]